MMRIQILSDTHLEKHKNRENEILERVSTNKNVDVLIIAGDLISHRHLKRTLEKICLLYPKVIYVPGNHDYWGKQSIDETETLLSLCQNDIPNLICDPCTLKVINGQRFILTTLWFQFEDPDVIEFGKSLRTQYYNDFSNVRNFFDEISFGRFSKQRQFILDNLREGDIVATHHLPSHKSVDPFYQNAKGNCFFVNDFEKEILERKPKLWIHGHTHRGADYYIGETRILCNPHGRPNEVESLLRFEDNLVVEI